MESTTTSSSAVVPYQGTGITRVDTTTSTPSPSDADHIEISVALVEVLSRFERNAVRQVED
jgi:hypothetical protein